MQDARQPNACLARRQTAVIWFIPQLNCFPFVPVAVSPLWQTSCF